MTRKIFIIIFSACLPLAMQGQPHYAQVLQSVEANSTSLRLNKSARDSRQAALMQGALLDDPHVELNYRWATQSDVENKWEASVTQTFRSPSFYRHTNALRHQLSDDAELTWRQQRRQSLLQVQRLCAELVYQNACVEHYGECLERYRQVADIYRQRMEQGDCGILDYNRAQTEYSMAQSRYNSSCMSRDALLLQLAAINGGVTLDFSQTVFESVVLPERFEVWYDSLAALLPELQLAESHLRQQEHALALSREGWLPSVEAGYAFENESGVRFHGILLGLNLPLWQNVRAVKSARLGCQEALFSLDDVQRTLRQHYELLYSQVSQMQSELQRLEGTSNSAESERLLMKSLLLGDMPLETYLQSVEFYHEVELTALGVHKELELAWLDLMSITL